MEEQAALTYMEEAMRDICCNNQREKDWFSANNATFHSIKVALLLDRGRQLPLIRLLGLGSQQVPCQAPPAYKTRLVWVLPIYNQLASSSTQAAKTECQLIHSQVNAYNLKAPNRSQ